MPLLGWNAPVAVGKRLKQRMNMEETSSLPMVITIENTRVPLNINASGIIETGLLV